MATNKGKKPKNTQKSPNTQDAPSTQNPPNPLLNPAVIAAIIGLIGTLAGLFFAYRQNTLPIEVSATQTAEARNINSAALAANIAALVTPTAEATPIPEPIVVATPQPGEILVLVSKLEAVGTGERDVSRFITDDLSQRLNLSFSNFVVREYPEIVSDKNEAVEVAETNRAAIIVWGNYTPDFIELNIQVGDISDFEDIVIKREDIEEAANLRVRIKNERQESIVQGIISSVIVLQTANSNTFESIRNLAILETIQVNLPESVTANVSGFVAKYCVYFVSDEGEALSSINQALALNGGNPLLYLFRGSIKQKLGDFGNAQQDVETALRLGSDNWGAALFLQANNLFLAGDPVGGIAAMDKVIAANTNDWWSYNIRGSYYFLLGDLSSARADFASAIALGPSANFPYVYSSIISMHEGRLADAKEFLVQALQISPDPTYGERIIYAYIGTKVNYPNLDALSAYGRLTLGQYSEAVVIADKGIQVFPLADLYFIKGAAECNLQQYKEAEESYIKGLELDPEYGLLYLLSADVKAKQGNLTGAQADITALQTKKQFALFAPYLQNPQSGAFTCETLFATSP